MKLPKVGRLGASPCKKSRGGRADYRKMSFSEFSHSITQNSQIDSSEYASSQSEGSSGVSEGCDEEGSQDGHEGLTSKCSEQPDSENYAWIQHDKISGKDSSEGDFEGLPELFQMTDQDKEAMASGDSDAEDLCNKIKFYPQLNEKSIQKAEEKK